MAGERVAQPGPGTEARSPDRVRVWDPAVRLFHWSLVASVAGAWLFVDPRSLHRQLGYVVLGLVLFRLLWGLVGTRHARFSDFVPGPRRLTAYLRAMARGEERRYLGHNPAGAAMILALLALLGGITATGIMMGQDAWFGVEWVEHLHETLVDGLIVLVVLHVAGVVLSSRRHRENLVASMIHGTKPRDDPADID